MKQLFFSAILMASLAITGCSEDRGINLFTVDQDKEFGESLVSSINAEPNEYPVLSKTENPEAYAYIEGMMNDILKSDKFKYGNKFDWEVFIIKKEVLNAFAAPGGKLYFYTGLINYLDDAASLAGVMGHEMAHADLRHSTQQMTKVYGYELLLNIILGQNQSQMTSIVKDMALGLGQLKFSRDNEYDADRYSMYYLATTKYQPLGITSFFKKMIANGETSSTIEWLSTHPSDQNRVDKANDTYNNDSDLKNLMSGHTYDVYQAEFEAFKATLQ